MLSAVCANACGCLFQWYVRHVVEAGAGSYKQDVGM